MKKLLIVVSLLLIIPLVFGGFALDFVTNTKSGSLKVDAQDVVVDKYGMRLDESLAGINDDLELCLDGVENLSENGEVFDERLSETEKVVDSCVEDIEDLSGEVSNFEGRLSETEDTLGSCVEDIESLLANGGSGSDNGFCLAKINLTGDLSGTIEMLNGSFEDVVFNPASLVLVLQDSLFFSYKGLNGEPKAAIYECPINTPSGQILYRCNLLPDLTVVIEQHFISDSKIYSLNLGKFVDFSVLGIFEGTLDEFPPLCDVYSLILAASFSDIDDLLIPIKYKGILIDDVNGSSVLNVVYEGEFTFAGVGKLIRCYLKTDGSYSVIMESALDSSVVPIFDSLNEITVLEKYTVNEDGTELTIAFERQNAMI